MILTEFFLHILIFSFIEAARTSLSRKQWQQESQTMGTDEKYLDSYQLRKPSTRRKKNELVFFSQETK